MEHPRSTIPISFLILCLLHALEDALFPHPTAYLGPAAFVCIEACKLVLVGVLGVRLMPPAPVSLPDLTFGRNADTLVPAFGSWTRGWAPLAVALSLQGYLAYWLMSATSLQSVFIADAVALAVAACVWSARHRGASAMMTPTQACALLMQLVGIVVVEVNHCEDGSALSMGMWAALGAYAVAKGWLACHITTFMRQNVTGCGGMNLPSMLIFTAICQALLGFCTIALRILPWQSPAAAEAMDQPSFWGFALFTLLHAAIGVVSFKTLYVSIL
jgi:hypothetical protein